MRGAGGRVAAVPRARARAAGGARGAAAQDAARRRQGVRADGGSSWDPTHEEL